MFVFGFLVSSSGSFRLSVILIVLISLGVGRYKVGLLICLFRVMGGSVFCFFVL